MGDSGSGYADRTSHAIWTPSTPTPWARKRWTRPLRSRNPAAIEPGAYDVVLEEYAVAEMLDYLAFIGFGALAVQEGRSFMRLGEPITGANITIVDDGHDPRSLPLAFDFEGVPKQRVDLIKNGVAARRGLRQLHRRARAGPRRAPATPCPPPTPTARSRSTCVLAPGTTPKADLVKDIERGLWITRFHYVNIVHPRADHPDRHDPRRHLPDRGRRGQRPGREPALHPERAGRPQARRAERHAEAAKAASVGGTLAPARASRGFNFSSATEF